MSLISPRKYYRKDLQNLYDFLVPKDKKTIKLSTPAKTLRGKYDYVILDSLIGDLKDVQQFLSKVKKHCRKDGRIIVTYYNDLWEYPLKLASKLGLRRKIDHEQNWLDTNDISNLLNLTGFEVITRQKRFLFPFYIPLLSELINKWLANLPVFNSLCLTTYVIARPKPEERREYSVSIVVPARNEEKNIPKIAPSIQKFGKRQEIIFVEGYSEDKTWEAIKKEAKKKTRKGVTTKALKQRGKGKSDAVRLGFKKASGEILMIYDADRTVDAKDLTKFYDAIANNLGEFANGCRLVYPMEKQAMRSLNKIGNQFFSSVFTWILGQRFKDTLCGTKVLFKKDYQAIVKGRKVFGDFDPFGDFDLIFGTIRQNLKVIEIPVRYKEREYGQTNIDRFRHGLLLLKMTLFAYKKFKMR